MGARWRIRVAAAVTAFAVAGSGCSILDGGDDSPGASSGGSSGTGTSTGTRGPAAGVDPGKVVVKATFPSPLADGATVEVKIHGLRAAGRLAVLTASLTPRVPGRYDEDISPYDINGEHGVEPYLVDTVNLKRHLVLKDAKGSALGSDDVYTNGSNNVPMYVSYTYAAPPPNVRTMDVYVGEWPPFRDVPVER